jgi:hypothetical protein
MKMFRREVLIDSPSCESSPVGARDIAMAELISSLSKPIVEIITLVAATFEIPFY